MNGQVPRSSRFHRWLSRSYYVAARRGWAEDSSREGFPRSFPQQYRGRCPPEAAIDAGRSPYLLRPGTGGRFIMPPGWRDGPTDTPGSVIARRYRRASGGHPSTDAVADALQRPTRALGRAALITRTVWPCSGWGLPSHAGHPARWWSLTPPFHPYCPCVGRGLLRTAVSFLWHWPAGYPEWALPTTLPCGARTFLGGTDACTPSNATAWSTHPSSILGDPELLPHSGRAGARVG